MSLCSLDSHFPGQCFSRSFGPWEADFWDKGKSWLNLVTKLHVQKPTFPSHSSPSCLTLSYCLNANPSFHEIKLSQYRFVCQYCAAPVPANDLWMTAPVLKQRLLTMVAECITPTTCNIPNLLFSVYSFLGTVFRKQNATQKCDRFPHNESCKQV